ncbi:MAG: hypothetical protein LC624_06585 [Halobacteriales archaeon]|nr:hypothetical protein [Halobacteriales archaeon]
MRPRRAHRRPEVSLLSPRERPARRVASRLAGIGAGCALLALLLDTDLAWYLWLGPVVERVPPSSAPLGIGATLALLLAAVLVRRQRGLARDVHPYAPAAVDAGVVVLGALGGTLLVQHLPFGALGPPVQALVWLLAVLGAARVAIGLAEARGPMRATSRVVLHALPVLALLAFAATYLGLRALLGLDQARSDLLDYALGLLLIGGFLAWQGWGARSQARRLPSASDAHRHVQLVRSLPDPQHAEAEDAVAAWVERGEGAARYEALVLSSLRAAQVREEPAQEALRAAQQPAERKRGEPDAARAARLAAHQRIVQLIAGPRSN